VWLALVPIVFFVQGCHEAPYWPSPGKVAGDCCRLLKVSNPKRGFYIYRADIWSVDCSLVCACVFYNDDPMNSLTRPAFLFYEARDGKWVLAFADFSGQAPKAVLALKFASRAIYGRQVEYWGFGRLNPQEAFFQQTNETIALELALEDREGRTEFGKINLRLTEKLASLDWHCPYPIPLVLLEDNRPIRYVTLTNVGNLVVEREGAGGLAH